MMLYHHLFSAYFQVYIFNSFILEDKWTTCKMNGVCQFYSAVTKIMRIMYLLKLIERIEQTHLDLSTQINKNYTWMLLLHVVYFFISIIYLKE